MEINELMQQVKKKLQEGIILQDIKIEDKSFLHKGHASSEKGKYHLKLNIQSQELKSKNKVEAHKQIHKILSEELKNYIHSIQILIR